MGDPELPPLFSRAEARRAGMSDRQITWRLKSGQWKAERRGILSLAGPPETNGRPNLGNVVAAWRVTAGGRSVVSHVSAARFWGLPTPLGATDEVTLTIPTGKPQRRDDVYLRVATLPPGDVARPGIAVTKVARTVADCLRSLPSRDGLAMADAALHEGRTSVEEVEAVLARQRGWRGVGRAREVLALADARRESPLESWSAWGFHEVGLPRPEWQVDILTAGGRFVARVDAWWPAGVVGEADGRAKYALRAAAAGQEVSPKRLQEVFDAEKKREARIRDQGADVVTWNAEDVLSPGPLGTLAARITDRVDAAAAHPRFKGHTRRN